MKTDPVHKADLPQAKDWNSFWSLDQTEKFTKASWSKRRIIHVMAPYIIKRKSALDAGCGSGFFSKYFCDQNMHTVSLDYSDEALQIALRMTEGRSKVVKMDLLSNELHQNVGERFDIIFSDGLLEHFSREDQNKIFQNFKSLLSKEGVIITFVPNRWSPWELIRPLFMPGIEETPFTLKQLVDLNQCNGLEVLQKGGVNTFPFAFSPDKFFGDVFGMLMFTIARKK